MHKPQITLFLCTYDALRETHNLLLLNDLTKSWLNITTASFWFRLCGKRIDPQIQSCLHLIRKGCSAKFCRKRGRVVWSDVLGRPWLQVYWFNSHPCLVVASLDKMLYDNYSCEVERNKQQIKEIRSKIQLENSEANATPKRVWFVLCVASSSLSRDGRIKMKKSMKQQLLKRSLNKLNACDSLKLLYNVFLKLLNGKSSRLPRAGSEDRTSSASNSRKTTPAIGYHRAGQGCFGLLPLISRWLLFFSADGDY